MERLRSNRRSPTGIRFNIGMMELPKGTISVRNLAYLALRENDQSSERAGYVRCATWVIHVACLLFVFSQRRLAVPQSEHRCEGTPLFFSAPRGRFLRKQRGAGRKGGAKRTLLKLPCGICVFGAVQNCNRSVLGGAKNPRFRRASRR